jgi:hypothetical protein
MLKLKEKFIVDSGGNRVAVQLDLADYRRVLDALEELESLRAFDDAIAARDKAVPFEQAVAEIKHGGETGT